MNVDVRCLAAPLLGVALAAGEPTAATYVSEIPKEFSATLFAKPPEVNYPVQVCAAGDGTLFVACDKNGSLGKAPKMGRIVRCRDGDGDGVADRFDLFVDDVVSPRGLGWDGRRLYCLHPPFVTAFEDVDGDGRAEKSTVLATGVGSTIAENKRGADHTSNGLRIGIDGWLYLAIGDFGCFDARGADGSRLQLRGGGVVRLRPDGGELELYDRGTRNCCDIALTPALDGFARDNTNDGGGWNVRLHQHVQLAEHGYPSLYKNFGAETFPMIADYGGGSGTGGLYAQEAALPGGYGDTLYTCDWGRSIVFRHALTPAGAGFTVDQKPFAKCDRVTDIDVDGMGRLYLASWKGGGFSFSNENVGAVVRLAPAGATPAPFPDLAKLGVPELVAAIGADSAVLRQEAQAELLRRGAAAAGASDALTRLAGGGGALNGRIAAIFTLKQLQGEASHPALVTLAQDKAVRAWALRALADRSSQGAKVPVEPFVQALADADPRVRVQAMIGIARLQRVEAADRIVPLARVSPGAKGPDLVEPHIAVRALQSLGAVDACLAALRGDAPADQLEGLLWALRGMHTVKAVDGLLARLDQAGDAVYRKRLLSTLIRLYQREGAWTQWSWWNVKPENSGPYYQRETWEGSAKIDAALRAAVAKDADTAAFVAAELKRHFVKHELAGPETKDEAEKKK